LNIEALCDELEKAAGKLADPRQHQVKIKTPDGKTLPITGVTVSRTGEVVIQTKQVEE
jgi:hypothetical protein